MKSNKLLIIFVAAALAACSSPVSEPGQQEPERKALEISLAPTTRAAVNYTTGSYFGLEGYEMADVTMTLGQEDVTRDYVYAYDGATGYDRLVARSAEETIWLPYDGTVDKITVMWPKSDARNDVPADQSERVAFLSADWLSAELTNVSPSEFIAVTLGHERSKLTFTLGGSAAGRKITYLTFGDYTAYCDPDTGIIDAQLIVPRNVALTVGTTGSIGYSGSDYIEGYRLDAVPTVNPQVSQNYNITISLD